MNQKGSSLIYILLLILLVIGGLGYYILNNQSRFDTTLSYNNSQSVFVHEKTPPAFPSAFPVLDTSNWKTYTNNLQKYTLKYPSNWTIDSSSANNLENYKESNCCNTAELKLSNGKVTWKFDINPLITGFSPPSECEPKDSCTILSKPMSVLGYSLEREIYTINSSQKIIYAQMITPGLHPGFGKIGITTQYVNTDQIKYLLSYTGTDLDINLDTLDTISQTLHSID